MMDFSIDDVSKYLKTICLDCFGVYMNPTDVVFEENVKMNCFYCSKYDTNWRCPPRIPNIDYKKMFAEFNHGFIIVLENSISNPAEFENIRRDSSLKLHKTLLMLEKWLWQHNQSNSISFGAGSCKICKDGCGKERCNNPGLARCSLEAVGVNVIKTCRKLNIDINFPIEKNLKRVGLLMWQE